MSAARGRGWLKETTKVTRPGIKSQDKIQDKDLSLIENEIKLIDLQNLNSSIRSLSKTMGLVHYYCTTSGKLEKMIEYLHSIALQDKIFGRKFATLCGQMANFQIDEILYRDEILKMLQKDFEETTYPEEKQVNAYAFLGEIFYRMRLQNGSCIIVLAEPIIQNLKTLLSLNENNFFIFTRQIALIGPELKVCLLEDMRQIMLDVRKILMTRPLSQTPRCLLLLSLDYDSNTKIPEHIMQFYSHYIDTKDVASLNDIKLTDFVIEPSPYQPEDYQTENISIGASPSPSSQSSTRSIKPDINNSPRDIREKLSLIDLRDKLNASKNDDKSPGKNWRSPMNNEFRKPKHLNQEKKPFVDIKPKNKAWMHDDRFYEDYEK